MIKKLFITAIMNFVLLMGFAQNTNNYPLAEFKLLLIIKPEFNLPQYDLVGRTMSEEKIEAIKQSYLYHLPKLCSRITDSMVVLHTEVVVSPNIVTTSSGSQTNFFLSPENLTTDIQDFSNIGEFDCIQFIYNLGEKVSSPAWGLTFPSTCYTPKINYAGYCTIVDISNTEDYANENSTVHEVFLHEWMHTLEKYYYDLLGVKEPFQGALDGAGNFGYGSDIHGRGNDSTTFYKGLELFYRDHLIGALYNYHTGEDLPNTGFGPDAYLYPTPSELFGSIYDPNWQPAPEMLAANLLLNPSFEEINADGTPVEWIADNRWFGEHLHTWNTDTAEHTHGSRSLYINAEEDVLFAMKQVLTLESEPHILLFNIKTRNIAAHEDAHNFGAGMLTWDNHPDGTWYSNGPSYQGNYDWTRGCKLFKTNPEYPVTTIAAAIGNWSSAAMGEAWFDEIVFVKLRNLKGSYLSVSDAKPQKTQGLLLHYSNQQIYLNNSELAWNELEIFDINGKIVMKRSIRGESTVGVSLQMIPSGMLFMRVTGKTSTQTAKIVHVR